MKAKANLWWIVPELWIDGHVSVVSRVMEDGAIKDVRRQATRLDTQLAKRIIALDYDYLRDYPTLMPFERIQLIAAYLEMSVHFVVDVLQEVDEMLECAV